MVTINRSLASHIEAAKVGSIQVQGVTNSNPAIIHKVPKGSAIKVYPTVAGAAGLYSSHSPISDILLESSADDIKDSVNADWDSSAAGIVSIPTIQEALYHTEAVALVPESGTWTIEITVG